MLVDAAGCYRADPAVGPRVESPAEGPGGPVAQDPFPRITARQTRAGGIAGIVENKSPYSLEVERPK